MNKYAIYCTEEQTKKALELGAPIKIETLDGSSNFGIRYQVTPTAEEMIGWLEEQGMNVNLAYNPFDDVKIIITKCGGFDEIANIKWNKSKKTAVLAAIDAALEYLENLKQ